LCKGKKNILKNDNKKHLYLFTKQVGDGPQISLKNMFKGTKLTCSNKSKREWLVFLKGQAIQLKW